MAGSTTTKQALAKAFKELLAEHPMEKISISDICDRCHMNRKSFYYHFRDKYDLVNWIFDTEFAVLNQPRSHEAGQSPDRAVDDRWEAIEVTCQYFYDNRGFYRKVLQIQGQNSFVSHFRDYLRPLLRLRVESLLEYEDTPQIVYDFVADGIISAIERWLFDKDCISVEEFMESLKTLLRIIFIGLEHRLSEDPQWLA